MRSIICNFCFIHSYLKLHSLGTTLSGNVGLVISQSLILTGMLQHGIRQTAEVSSQMTSVERVLQYTNIEQEGPFESIPTKKPHRDWPKAGAVRFEKLYLRYIPTEEPILRNLNIVIKPGEKVLYTFYAILVDHMFC